MDFLGVDVGRTSIKYGVVSLAEQFNITEFNTIVVPQQSRFENYYSTLEKIVHNTSLYQGVGFGFPCVIQNDEIRSRDINFNEIWAKLRTIVRANKSTCYAINDADAAGIAEVYRNGADELRKGVAVVLTLGTGIGSAVFVDGKLLPNAELGLLEMHGKPAEIYAAPSVINRESISLQEWASRIQEYLIQVEKIINPNHIVVGGGISTDFEGYGFHLNTHAPIHPAYFKDRAGVVGAAMYASLRLLDDEKV